MLDANRVMIVDLDDGLGLNIQESIGLDAEGCKSASGEAIDDVLGMIERTNPAITFFGVSDAASQMLPLIERVASVFPKMGVVVAAPSDSPELILKLLRAGADEFFTLPCTPDVFKGALQRVCRKKGILGVPSDGSTGKTIATFSGKGGCGTTMIAANLAWNLSGLSGQPVAVVDFDLQFGDLATMMDVPAAHTVADAIGDDGTLDEDLISEIVVEHPSGVAVIAAPNDPADGENITGEHASTILKRLRGKYGYVIVDTSCAFNGCSLSVLDEADEIILVTDTLVPSIRAAERSTHVFEKLDYDQESIHLVVNRFNPKGELSVEELEKAFKLPIFHILPNDFDIAMTAIDAGVPVAEVAERRELASSLRELAAKFVEGAEEDVAGATGGVLGMLTHLFKK